MKRIAFVAAVAVALFAGLTIARAQGPIAKADKIINARGTMNYTGHVSIEVNGISITADEASYVPGTRTLTLRGNVSAVLPEDAK